MFDDLTQRGFDVATQHHAGAILKNDMGKAAAEIETVLKDFTIPIENLVRGGGGETDSTQRLRKAFVDIGWRKHNFVIQKVVDGTPRESTSHEIDHVKLFNGYTFALEIEWNNKDPFYDRDLENFKRLHSEGAISMAGIITRGKSMHDSIRSMIQKFALDREISSVEKLKAYYTPTPRQAALYTKRAKSVGSFAQGWSECFCADKFGEASTHWRKLEERIARGVGNPCPLVFIGLPASIVTS